MPDILEFHTFSDIEEKIAFSMGTRLDAVEWEDDTFDVRWL